MVIKKQSIYLIIVNLFLLCAAMNFKAKFFYFAFGIGILVCLHNIKIKINFVAYIYGILGIIMGIYSLSNGFMASIKPLAYVVCYIAGVNLIISKKHNFSEDTQIENLQEKRIKAFIAILAIGSFLHLMLNWGMSFGEQIGRNRPDVWSGEILSATSQASIGCLMVGFSSSLILCPTKKYGRLIGTLFAMMLLGYNMVLGGRTLIMMYLLVVSTGYIYMLIKNKKNHETRKFVIWIILLIIVFGIAFYKNVGGIQDTIVSSNLYQRFFGEKVEIDIMQSGREEKKIEHFKNIVKNPFGGCSSRKKIGYAHDLLLDAHDEYGIVVLFLLIFILINSIYNILKIIKRKHIRMEFKITIISIYCAIFAQFCLEPIFAGMPWLFVCFSFLNGCISEYNKSVQKVK